MVKERQAVCDGVWRVKKLNAAAGDWNTKMHKMKQIRDDVWKGEGTKRQAGENSLAFYVHSSFSNRSLWLSQHLSAPIPYHLSTLPRFHLFGSCLWEERGKKSWKKIDLCQVCVCLHFRSLDRFVTRQRFSAAHLVKLSVFCKTLHPLTDWLAPFKEIWNLQHFQEKLHSWAFKGRIWQIFLKYKEPQMEILVGNKIDLPVHMKTSTVHY